MNSFSSSFSPGETVVGTVVGLEPTGAIINIGTQTPAYLPLQEISIACVNTPEEVLQLNETREFWILAYSEEREQSRFTLSLRRLEEKLAWERIRQIQAECITLSSRIVATNDCGALVRIENVQGLIPSSEIINDKPIEELIGEELILKFIEVDENSNRLVLSHQQALDYELTRSNRKRFFVGKKEYQSDAIKNVTELGLEYIDENGNPKFIDFKICRQNSVEILNYTGLGLEYSDENGNPKFIDFKICRQNSVEILNYPEFVAVRNIIGYPYGTAPYIEFFTEPLTKFVFNRKEIFRGLHMQMKETGWLTFDLS
jgi:predicted RNA-binding protein with RPS1 domain